MSVDPQKIAEQIAAAFYTVEGLAADSEDKSDSAFEFKADLTHAFALVEKGWKAFYSHYFGQSFVDSLALHHEEAIKWHWDSRLAFLKGERPDYLAYFPIWSRGHMKSTLAEHIVVVDAMLSVLFGQTGFCLYIGREKTKVQENVANIETLLTCDLVRADFPDLSRVKRNQETNQKRQWTATFLHTSAGYVVKGGTIDSAQAGSRVVKTRPTFIVPDDIDDRKASPVISENNFKQLTTEILPMRQGNTLVYFAQNLISRYSVMYRIQKQHARVLTNRRPTQPIPAVLNLQTDVRTIDGIVKDIFVSGESTWPQVWDKQRIQDEIESEGLPAFLRECQHEVEQDSEGLVLKNYNDAIHVISLSEFAAIFGTREIPQKWNKYVFNDWARTKTKNHANVAGILTVSAQNSQLPGIVFLFHPMSFPANSAPEDVAERLLTTISPQVRSQYKTFTWVELIKATLQKLDIEELTSSTSELLEKRRTLLARVIPPLVSPILSAQNYKVFRGSHEQSKTGALEVYRKYFGLPFRGVNPGGDGGIDKFNFLLKVDYNTPHPFRNMMGYSNYYIVVPDEKLAFNESLTPDDLHDSDLVRYQFRNWRFRDPHLTIAGEQEGELLKMNDDFGNGHMMLLYDELLSAAPLTYSEKVESLIPEKYKRSTLQTNYSAQHEMSVAFQEARAKQKIKPTVRQWNYLGEEIGVEEE